MKTLLVVLSLSGAGGFVAWSVYQQLENTAEKTARKGAAQPVPVEIADIEHGPLELQRTFTGTLEARAEFVVAPKVTADVWNS